MKVTFTEHTSSFTTESKLLLTKLDRFTAKTQNGTATFIFSKNKGNLVCPIAKQLILVSELWNDDCVSFCCPNVNIHHFLELGGFSL